MYNGARNQRQTMNFVREVGVVICKQLMTMRRGRRRSSYGSKKKEEEEEEEPFENHWCTLKDKSNRIYLVKMR